MRKNSRQASYLIAVLIFIAADCTCALGDSELSQKISQKPAISSLANKENKRQILSQKNKKRKKPACNDRKDNDKDGLTDYPADPGCKNKRDKKEKNKAVVVNPGSVLKRPFPDDNPWNKDISAVAVDPNSDNLIASIGLNTGLHPDFGTYWEGQPIGIPFTVVSANQPKININRFLYDDESDHGLYPIPPDAPIEGGPDSDGDRHVIVVDKDNWKLYELYRAFPVNGGWKADSGAIFDLSSNKLRPEGWTSADAAGLPIFPGLVRYEEVVEQKEIKHALRFTCRKTRRAYISPARHYASSSDDPNLPPMGMRVRLKADFDISPYPENVRVILKALKTYGMFVADNGSDWFISGAPDMRWDDEELSVLKNVKGRNFEVVKMGE